MPTPAEDLNTALRELIEVVRTADLAGVELGREIASVNQITDELRSHHYDGMRMQAALRYGDHMEEIDRRISEAGAADTAELAAMGNRSPNDFFPYSPIVGSLNPIAPPVRMWQSDGADGAEIHGEVSLGAAYNGPPDCAHGGVIAAIFDELLGAMCVANGLGGFTGTLTVIYRSPTPLGEQLTMRGWHDRTDGRKTFAKATLHHADTLCAEAEGVFIRSPLLPGGGGPPPPRGTA